MVSQLQKNLINFVLGGAMVVGISNLALYLISSALCNSSPFHTSFYLYLLRKE